MPLYLYRMKNFTVEADGATFEFNTMNIQRLQLFQVYVTHNGEKKRFHMQINDQGEFKITDPQSCPGEYHRTEEQLNKAIQIYGKP